MLHTTLFLLAVLGCVMQRASGIDAYLPPGVYPAGIFYLDACKTQSVQTVVQGRSRISTSQVRPGTAFYRDLRSSNTAPFTSGFFEVQAQFILGETYSPDIVPGHEALYVWDPSQQLSVQTKYITTYREPTLSGWSTTYWPTNGLDYTYVMAACLCGYYLQVTNRFYGRTMRTTLDCLKAQHDSGIYMCPQGWKYAFPHQNYPAAFGCWQCSTGQYKSDPWVITDSCYTCGCGQDHYMKACSVHWGPECALCESKRATPCRYEDTLACTVDSEEYDINKCLQIQVQGSGQCPVTLAETGLQADHTCVKCVDLARQTCAPQGSAEDPYAMTSCTENPVRCERCLGIETYPAGMYLGACQDGLPEFRSCSNIAAEDKAAQGSVHVQCGEPMGEFGPGLLLSCNDFHQDHPYGQFMKTCSDDDGLSFADCASEGIQCAHDSFQVLCGVHYQDLERSPDPTLLAAQALEQMSHMSPGQCMKCDKWAEYTCDTDDWLVLINCGGPASTVVDKSTWEGGASGECVPCPTLNVSYCDPEFLQKHGPDGPDDGFYFTDCSTPRQVSAMKPLKCEACDPGACDPGQTLKGCGGVTAGMCTACELLTDAGGEQDAGVVQFDTSTADPCDWYCAEGRTGAQCMQQCVQRDLSCATALTITAGPAAGLQLRQHISPCLPPLLERCSTCLNAIPAGAELSGPPPTGNLLKHGSLDSFLFLYDFTGQAADRVREVHASSESPTALAAMFEAGPLRTLSDGTVKAVKCLAQTVPTHTTHSLHPHFCSATSDPAQAFVVLTATQAGKAMLFPTQQMWLNRPLVATLWTRLYAAPEANVTFNVSLNASSHVADSRTVLLSPTAWTFVRFHLRLGASPLDELSDPAEYHLAVSAACPGADTDVAIDELMLYTAEFFATFDDDPSLAAWQTTGAVSSLDAGAVLAAPAGVNGGVSGADSNGDPVDVATTAVLLNGTAQPASITRPPPASMPPGAWVTLDLALYALSRATVTVTSSAELREQLWVEYAAADHWQHASVSFEPFKASDNDRTLFRLTVQGGAVLVDNVVLAAKPQSCPWRCPQNAVRKGTHCEACSVSRDRCSPLVSTYPTGCTRDGYKIAYTCADCTNAPPNSVYVLGEDACQWVCADGYYPVQQEGGTACSPCTTDAVCPTGQYLRACASSTVRNGFTVRLSTELAQDSSCQPCTGINSITTYTARVNAVYTSAGTGYNKDNCEYRCSEGYYMQSNGCYRCSRPDCSKLTGVYYLEACSASADATCTPCPEPPAGRTLVPTTDEPCATECSVGHYRCTNCDMLYAPPTYAGDASKSVLQRLHELQAFRVISFHPGLWQTNVPQTEADPQISAVKHQWANIRKMLAESIAYTPVYKYVTFSLNPSYVSFVLSTKGYTDIAVSFALRVEIDYLELQMNPHNVRFEVKGTDLAFSEQIHADPYTFTDFSWHTAALPEGDFTFVLHLRYAGTEKAIVEATLWNPEITVTPRGVRGVDTERDFSCMDCAESGNSICWPCADIALPPNATGRARIVNGESVCEWVCEGDFVRNDQAGGPGDGCAFCPVLQCEVGEYMSTCAACAPCTDEAIPLHLRGKTRFVTAGEGRFESNCEFQCSSGHFQRSTGLAPGYTCTPCTAPSCSAGQFLVPCAGYTDSACQTCSPACAAGSYRTQDCNSTSDIVCEPCSLEIHGELPAGAEWAAECNWTCTPAEDGDPFPGIASAVYDAALNECRQCTARCAVGHYATSCTAANAWTGCAECAIPAGAVATSVGLYTNNSCEWRCAEGNTQLLVDGEVECRAPPTAPPPQPPCLISCVPGFYRDTDAGHCRCRPCPSPKPRNSIWLGLPVTLEYCRWSCVSPFTTSLNGSTCIQLTSIDELLRLEPPVTYALQAVEQVPETNRLLLLIPLAILISTVAGTLIYYRKRRHRWLVEGA